MQILSLGLIFCDDINAIKHAQLRDVIEDLAAIVLLVLHGVKAEVKLSQQVEFLNILELKHLHDVIE